MTDVLVGQGNNNVDRRPNVLFVAIDDLRPELGCYGASHVVSPNINSLASEGMLFERAYCQQPLCNPSRTSVMTGLRPESIAVTGNHVYFRDLRPDVVTLPQYFANHGYYSVGIGKIYHGPFPDDAMCVKWDRLDDPPSWSEPAIRFGPRYYFTETGIAEAKKVFGKRYPDAEPGEWENALLFGPMTEAPDVTDNQLYDGKVAEAAVSKLRELATRSQPFFLGIGFIKPHTPFIAPRKSWDKYDSAKIPAANNPEFPDSAPRLGFHNSGEIRRYSDQPNKGPLGEANQQNLKHGYVACVSHVDAQVGIVLNELERLGLRKNTIVVLWGDHGYHLGEQGMWGKHTLFENAARVPLIISAPSALAKGKRSGSLVELVDLFPTLVDLCELPAMEGLEGTSLRSLFNDAKLEVKNAAFTDQPAKGNWNKGGEIVGRSIRTNRYRYTAWIERESNTIVENGEQLYDHQFDPLETTNLAKSSDHIEVVQDLRERLFAGWREAIISNHTDRKP